MELCIRPTTLLRLNRDASQSLCRISPAASLKNPFLHLSNKNPYSSYKFPSLSRHIQPPTFPRCSETSSSSRAVRTEKDLLPDIGVTETEEPNSRLRLSVEVPSSVCEDCYKRVLDELMKKAKIPGFRPGLKVPEEVLLKYAGKRTIENATVESILKRTIPHALASVTGRALRDSVRIVTKFSDMQKTYSSLNSLRYDVIVDVAPEVRWIPENGYENLKIVVEIDSEIDARRALEKELRSRLVSLCSMRIVTDRGLQVGDTVVIDVSGTIIDREESTAQKIQDVEIKGFCFNTEDHKLLDGFLDSIIGIQPGETKSFVIVYPESWPREEFCGVHAQFTVECKELFYRDLPELDDSLADKLVPGCTTLQQVKESLLQKCLEYEQRAREQATDNVILDQLCKMIEVDIPLSLFEEQGRELYGAKLLQMQANMKLNDEQLASLSSPNAVNQYLENQRENITKVIRQGLAVGDIFRRENLQTSTDELVKEVKNSIAEFKRHKQEYDEERVKEQVQEILEGAKVLEWLKEQAEIQYITRAETESPKFCFFSHRVVPRENPI